MNRNRGQWPEKNVLVNLVSGMENMQLGGHFSISLIFVLTIECFKTQSKYQKDRNNDHSQQ